ncbi:MAG: metalloregulator ArsR/SmtB family transcription factor [Anaerolineales bacterium]|nr:metalloregulator ArsR/SmtB family transcription factor [Anaerolineales bacterium]
MNIKKFARKTSDLFSVLGNDFRIRLLYAIGDGEVCVCHLEEMLQKRQPYISQHLSVLRDEKVLKTRREGRFIFYRITDPAVFDLLQIAAELQGVPEDKFPEITTPQQRAGCPCPACEDETTLNTEASPKKIKEIS